MVPPPRDGTQRRELPTSDVEIQILRGEARILVPERAELHLATDPDDPHHAQRVRFVARGDLMCDEMIMVYGRPLAWAGPQSGGDEAIPLVESIFGRVFILRPDEPEVITPVPRVCFPDQKRTVAWNYGTVLLRGDDPPWNGSGILHIHAAGDAPSEPR